VISLCESSTSAAPALDAAADPAVADHTDSLPTDPSVRVPAGPLLPAGAEIAILMTGAKMNGTTALSIGDPAHEHEYAYIRLDNRVYDAETYCILQTLASHIADLGLVSALASVAKPSLALVDDPSPSAPVATG
jgi:hypothetical protein